MHLKLFALLGWGIQSFSVTLSLTQRVLFVSLCEGGEPTQSEKTIFVFVHAVIIHVLYMFAVLQQLLMFCMLNIQCGANASELKYIGPSFLCFFI